MGGKLDYSTLKTPSKRSREAQTPFLKWHKKPKSRSKFQIVAGAQFPATIFASTYIDAKIFPFSSYF